MTRRALVVGGSGPTGPLVVNGLIERGFAVSVLSTGRHPVKFAGSVERITADPHFSESLEAALAGRRFDVAVANYGRLRLVAAALAGRTDQLIAISTRAYPGWLDSASMFRPEDAPADASALAPRTYDGARPVSEDTPLEPLGKFGQRIVEADRAVREHGARGDFAATILRYPRLYGPRQDGATEWSIIRRLRDGRRRIIAPEGGFLVRSALYNANAARIVLAAVDRPEVAAGETFNCADAEVLTLRRWISVIAEEMGSPVELVSVPMELAAPAWPYARYPLATGHQILDTTKLARLGVALIPAEEALRETVRWYLDDPARGEAVEPLLRDAFDYGLEDRIIAEMARSRVAIAAVTGDVLAYSHAHAHPRAPGET
ncbi:NAD(P)-dependent oxidoreductase [Sphingomonas sp. J315]|uniref:NAD-dependent epimerase/dehydratase family protein n=1 Tax=Sphingomonas sp. J315 TaxID=2898433 RepID=UPI0021AD8173|nr:NAD-dependent epimerase/dehydratase family protein [Sphingomonas sp. J315]UUX99226.1 NAD-dependent epimerase/dehydratase family protein [Sphingomonas sp. J315]